MKLITTSLFIFVCTIIYGQSIFFDDSQRASNVLDILSIDDREYIIASNSNDFYGAQIKWYKADTLFRNYETDTYIHSIVLENTSEGVFVEMYSFFHCDVVIPSFQWFLLDTLSSSDLPSNATENILPHFANLERLDDNTIVLIEGDAITEKATGLRVIINDLTIAQFGIPNDKITELSEIGDYLFIYGQDYAFRLTKSNLELDTLNYEGQDVLNIVETNDPDKVAILTDQQVDLLNIVTSEIETYSIDIENGAPKDIIFTDQLYLLRNQGEVLNEVQLVNNNGEWETVTSDLYQGVNFDQLYKMYDGEVWMTGSYTNFVSDSYPQEGAYVIQKLDSQDDSQNDISLEFLGFSGDGFNELEVSLAIKNNSDTDLENIHIYSNNLFRFLCFEQYFDITVSLISAGEDLILTETIELLNPNFDGELCFYTLGSEKDVDAKFEDNSTCAIITSIGDIHKVDEKFNIYPNPVFTSLFLEGVEKQTPVQIYDSDGRLVISEIFNKELNVQTLPPGLYFIHCNDGQEDLITKFVKI